jgi:hypothetical protein
MQSGTRRGAKTENQKRIGMWEGEDRINPAENVIKAKKPVEK